MSNPNDEDADKPFVLTMPGRDWDTLTDLLEWTAQEETNKEKSDYLQGLADFIGNHLELDEVDE